MKTRTTNSLKTETVKSPERITHAQAGNQKITNGLNGRVSKRYNENIKTWTCHWFWKLMRKNSCNLWLKNHEIMTCDLLLILEVKMRAKPSVVFCMHLPYYGILFKSGGFSKSVWDLGFSRTIIDNPGYKTLVQGTRCLHGRVKFRTLVFC